MRRKITGLAIVMSLVLGAASMADAAPIDQNVSVSATVQESINFSIATTTIAFGTLTVNNARYATASGGSSTESVGHTMLAGTNASGGYSITVTGTTLAATSSDIDAIGAVSTVSTPGTEQFGIRITASGGSGSVSSPYASSTGYAFDTAAFPDQVASASAPSSNTTYSVYYLANIAALTPAGSYTTALTYTATGNF